MGKISSGSSYLLSHGGEKSLRVEEACHPEHVWASVKDPAAKLDIPLQQLGEPESNRRGLPGYLSWWKWHVVISNYCGNVSLYSHCMPVMVIIILDR